MDYRVASNIRGKSLSSLMTDKITSGKGIGSALGGAISDKLKAKATGVKEKFDPMNIAKFMTGGSRLAPAIMGRLTGRSQSDINYFAGDKGKKGNYTQIPTSMATPGEGLGGSAVEVLNKMLSFMQRSREEDLKKKETAKQFIEEQKNEEQRRHKEFLEILREYTSLSGPTTLVKKEEGGDLLSGLMSTIKSMINTAVSGVLTVVNGLIDGFKKSLDWLGDLKTFMSFLGGNSLKLLLSLGKFLINPFTIGLFAAIAGGAAIMWLGEKLKDYFRENVVNMKALSPEKAAELLQTPGAFRTIEEYGGREAVLKIAKEGHLEAEKILATGDIKKINDAGGRPFLEQVVARGAVTVPESAAKEDLSQFEKELKLKRPKGSGLAVKNEQAKWDALYGKIYDPETGKRLDLISPPSTVPAKMSETPATAPTPKQESTTTPIPQTPMSSRMNDAVQENQDLSVAPPGNTQTPPPVLTTNTSTVDLPDRPIPATASVRDKTPILDHVLQQSLVPV